MAALVRCWGLWASIRRDNNDQTLTIAYYRQWTSRQLLQFLQNKYETEGDIDVGGVTIRELLDEAAGVPFTGNCAKANVDRLKTEVGLLSLKANTPVRHLKGHELPYAWRRESLTSLVVPSQANHMMFMNFDHFNASFTPMGSEKLRQLAFAYDSPVEGRWPAELLRIVCDKASPDNVVLEPRQAGTYQPLTLQHLWSMSLRHWAAPCSVSLAAVATIHE